MALNETDEKRLRWHCRRGMQEIDLLLQRYLATCWAGASSSQRAAFVAFVELTDPELERYLLKGEVDPQAAFAELATQIRGLAFAARH